MLEVGLNCGDRKFELAEMRGARPRMEEEIKDVEELMNEAVDVHKRAEMGAQIKEVKGRRAYWRVRSSSRVSGKPN